MTVTGQPVLVEELRDESGSCVVAFRWFCEPPPFGVTYRVTSEKWRGVNRDIYDWEWAGQTVDCGDFTLKVLEWGESA